MTYLAGEVAWMSANVTVAGRELAAKDIHEATEPLGPVAGDRIDSYFAFTSGVAGFFDSRRDSVGVNERYGMEIVGSEGTVSLRGGSTGQGLMIYPYPLWAPARGEQGWRPLTLDDAPPGDANALALAHRIAVLDLIEAIETGREPICSGRDGVVALEMALAAYDSQITGARVPFPVPHRTHPLERMRQHAATGGGMSVSAASGCAGRMRRIGPPPSDSPRAALFLSGLAPDVLRHRWRRQLPAATSQIDTPQGLLEEQP